jgi:hypothetical protein
MTTRIVASEISRVLQEANKIFCLDNPQAPQFQYTLKETCLIVVRSLKKWKARDKTDVTMSPVAIYKNSGFEFTLAALQALILRKQSIYAIERLHTYINMYMQAYIHTYKSYTNSGKD